MLLSLIIHWVLTAIVLLLVGYIMPGIIINGFGTALMAAFVMGLINVLIRPILSILTLPINLLTLGIFGLIVNALLFALAAAIVPGFAVTNFLSAFFGAILLTIITALVDNMTPSNRVSRV
jgi:putative membrane protein